MIGQRSLCSSPAWQPEDGGSLQGTRALPSDQGDIRRKGFLWPPPRQLPVYFDTTWCYGRGPELMLSQLMILVTFGPGVVICPRAL